MGDLSTISEFEKSEVEMCLNPYYDHETKQDDGFNTEANGDDDDFWSSSIHDQELQGESEMDDNVGLNYDEFPPLVVSQESCIDIKLKGWLVVAKNPPFQHVEVKPNISIRNVKSKPVKLEMKNPRFEDTSKTKLEMNVVDNGDVLKLLNGLSPLQLTSYKNRSVTNKSITELVLKNNFIALNNIDESDQLDKPSDQLDEPRKTGNELKGNEARGRKKQPPKKMEKRLRKKAGKKHVDDNNDDDINQKAMRVSFIFMLIFASLWLIARWLQI